MRFLFFITSIIYFQANALATDINVCVDCEIATLQHAVELAKNGDNIFLKKGVYTVQELRIQKRLHISGEQGSILDGGGKTILYINHDSVHISNLELRNVATNYVEDRAAIKCNSSDYLHINNVTVRHSFFGLLIEKSKHGIIENCNVQGDADENNYLESANGNAIHLWYCNDMKVMNNTVKKHRDGIYFEFVKNTLITNNYSEGNMRYGLHFMFSHNNIYEENTFTKNGAGVAVMYSDNVQMHRNKFIDNWGESSYGLLLKDIRDSELSNNLFRN
ncbi:MAG: NosD domain-containing protein, partial [Salibacteraceae bacterium]